ncbi:MAG: tRNA (adenosine(37)-N6)-dimethylallyltransferase MiaA [Gemmatimonadales bacterium]
MSERPPVGLAIVGATATGKTGLAIDVARRLNGEIIGVDSRQAYSGMEVGTAAPAAAELAAVPHHGIGFLDPVQAYSAGDFARRAREWMREIIGKGRLPVLAGGTGFFLHALTHPVFEEPPMDPARRVELRRWLASVPAETARKWSEKLDPEWSRRIAVLDRQRAARAVEVALLSGHRLSWWQERAEPAAEPVSLMAFGMALAPELHRERIRGRIERQFETGWPAEVEALRAAGVPPDAPAMNAVGYREVAAFLDGDIGREEAIEEIARQSWGYARRQRTWFRNQLPGVRWLDATEPIEHLAELVEREWRGR